MCDKCPKYLRMQPWVIQQLEELAKKLRSRKAEAEWCTPIWEGDAKGLRIGVIANPMRTLNVKGMTPDHPSAVFDLAFSFCDLLKVSFLSESFESALTNESVFKHADIVAENLPNRVLQTIEREINSGEKVDLKVFLRLIELSKMFTSQRMGDL